MSRVRGRRGERGVILATCLLLLLITALLATAGIREAVLELAKTGSEQAAVLAFTAAETGLALTLASGGFAHTAPRELPETPLANGARWRSGVRFLGVTPLAEPVPAGDHAWHFAVESEGRGPQGAASRQRLQLRVIGGAPDDLARCLSVGCAVPLPGGAPDPVPMRVAWHEIEDET